MAAERGAEEGQARWASKRSATRNNKLPKLKLSWLGQLRDSQRALRFGEEGCPHLCCLSKKLKFINHGWRES